MNPGSAVEKIEEDRKLQNIRPVSEMKTGFSTTGIYYAQINLIMLERRYIVFTYLPSSVFSRNEMLFST